MVFSQVIPAFQRMRQLIDTLSLFLRHTSPTAFLPYKDDIAGLHRGIIAILRAIDRDPSDMRSHGLRLSPSDWRNHPNTAEEALQELKRTMVAVGRSLDGFHRYNLLDGHEYDLIFATSWSIETVLSRGGAGHTFEEIREGSAPEDVAMEDEQVSGDLPGMIDGLGVVVAPREYVQEGLVCTICIEGILEGQEIRFLPCSHVFHRSCVDGWLRSNSSCPNDGLPVLEDGVSMSWEQVLTEGPL